MALTVCPRGALNLRILSSTQSRSVLFLSARVHPGESNSSHVIQGTLDALLAPTPLGRALRAAHVFKVVPMLNVEGVVNGW